MKTKLFLVLAVLLAITGITSYAERLDNISIVEDVKCYQENESIYVASESDERLAGSRVPRDTGNLVGSREGPPSKAKVLLSDR